MALFSKLTNRLEQIITVVKSIRGAFSSEFPNDESDYTDESETSTNRHPDDGSGAETFVIVRSILIC